MNTMRILILALGLISCSGDDEIRKVLLSHFDKANQHDAAGLKSDYQRDATGTSPNWGKEMHSADSITYQYGRLFYSTPDLKLEVLHTLVGKDHAVVEYRFSGTLENIEEGTPEYMRGKKYSFPATTVFEFKEGKIIREASYFDQVAFLRQVGFFEPR